MMLRVVSAACRSPERPQRLEAASDAVFHPERITSIREPTMDDTAVISRSDVVI